MRIVCSEEAQKRFTVVPGTNVPVVTQRFPTNNAAIAGSTFTLDGWLDAATTAISDRSGATAGDKSVLDSLLQIHAALDAASTDEGMMKLATDAAIIALDEFRERQCRLGRARMYGARTVGRDDPGMLAVSLLLQAMA